MLPIIILCPLAAYVLIRSPAISAQYAFGSSTPSTSTSAPFLLSRTTTTPYYKAPAPGPIQPYNTVTSAGAVLTGNATAVMYSAQGYGLERNILGTLALQQFTTTLPNGSTVRYVNITGVIISIFPGNNNHGFHIHERVATVENDGCSGLGKHYNPRSVNHGPQTGNATTRHVGDLGNIRSDSSGRARISLTDYVIQIGTKDKTFDVVGRSISVHLSLDDLGIGGADESLISGNAGSIIACGNIQWYRSPLSSSSIQTSRPAKIGLIILLSWFSLAFVRNV